MMNKCVIPMMMMICMACTVSLVIATQQLNSNAGGLQVEAQPSHIRHYSTQWERNLKDGELFYTNIRQGK